MPFSLYYAINWHAYVRVDMHQKCYTHSTALQCHHIIDIIPYYTVKSAYI